MFIQQLYTNCLAEAAYYIESDGEVAIVDPMRETDQYVELAKSRGAKIKYVFETHFHADFVSGHVDLASKTDSTIVFGPNAQTGYKAHTATDGEIFSVGKLKIKLLHTPGHTIESSCYLLYDESGKEYCVFTGDTLFVGDVGRPDLLDGSIKLTREEMAGMLFDSLNKYIKTLPDDLIVYPAHGPGSACGKNIGKETWSTIGQQKKSNYALQNISKAEFIKVLTSDLVAPPAYFFSDAKINKNGYDQLDTIIARNLKELSPEEFEREIAGGALVLDTRIPDEFEKGFVKGALNIGLDGTFAVWVGTLVDINRPLILVTSPGKEEESVLRLARVGYENVRGYLKDGMNSWNKAGKPVDQVQSVTPENFAKQVKAPAQNVVDVRKPSEVNSGRVKGSIHISLQDLPSHMNELDKNAELFVHCAGGYRSMIAMSILKANGYTNIKNVYGGYSKIKETAIEVV